MARFTLPGSPAWSGWIIVEEVKSKVPGVMYWIDRAVENFDELWPILMRLDTSKASEHAGKKARRKHFELLQANRNLLKRVPTISSLTRSYMKGANWVAAIGVTKILDTIQEGETIIYGGLEFSRVEGDVITTPLKKR